jgi:hypothetical protein
MCMCTKSLGLLLGNTQNASFGEGLGMKEFRG